MRVHSPRSGRSRVAMKTLPALGVLATRWRVFVRRYYALPSRQSSIDPEADAVFLPRISAGLLERSRPVGSPENPAQFHRRYLPSANTVSSQSHLQATAPNSVQRLGLDSRGFSSLQPQFQPAAESGSSADGYPTPESHFLGRAERLPALIRQLCFVSSTKGNTFPPLHHHQPPTLNRGRTPLGQNERFAITPPRPNADGGVKAQQPEIPFARGRDDCRRGHGPVRYVTTYCSSTSHAVPSKSCPPSGSREWTRRPSRERIELAETTAGGGRGTARGRM
ncbi:hypothetical protein CMUS01_02570 [Colletotrichum musicola]|uniref:Uncharacterized protein n=1 Tax=Colletotrichum musicola TaxID=2175873 RepID=A0A8H6NUX8_9PEZI|nr:hypothetical protein CMUS01_02570 [Colletotrichum musicola]